MTGPYYVLQPDPANPDVMQVIPVTTVLLTDVENSAPLGVFGVTVDEVYALCPDAERVTTVADGDTTTPITEARVARWIFDVTGAVTARVAGWDTITDTTHSSTVTAAGHAVVAVGAASYLEAARYAVDRGVNDAGTYADVLWERYKTGLADLAKLVDKWVPVTVLPDGDGTPRGPFGSFPCPAVPDDLDGHGDHYVFDPYRFGGVW